VPSKHVPDGLYHAYQREYGVDGAWGEMKRVLQEHIEGGDDE
jgi:hypothetical protein